MSIADSSRQQTMQANLNMFNQAYILLSPVEVESTEGQRIKQGLAHVSAKIATGLLDEANVLMAEIVNLFMIIRNRNS